MAPVARGLADRFRVLEPWQRRGGGEALTVARHVADLHELILGLRPGERPALVGSSWGAMLALAYAAAHPEFPGQLVLVGCGTFEEVARARFQANVNALMDDALQRRLEGLRSEFPDPDERLTTLGQLLLPLFSCDLLTTELEIAACDARGHRETMADMLRLQDGGHYPAAFSAITAPVLMLHGALDPHPGALIRDSLAPHLPQLEYHEWERCGHYPWLERQVREQFFAMLARWLEGHLVTRT
jgi:pimeloyl-ACP methyl ester carboxylesterase